MPGKRIETIDILRGFALAGILYAHMVIWYTGAAIPTDTYFKYNNNFDTVVLAVFGAFVFGKFFSVFSFLFGLSFYLNYQKNESKSGFLGRYIWRLFLLLIIGIVHHIFWRGDILAIYACLGVLLLFFRSLSYKFLWVLSLVLITNLPVHLFDLIFPSAENSGMNYPMAAEAKNYYNLVRNGDLLTNFRENWNSWSAKIEYQLESGRLLMTFGYFLLGLYAGKIRLFSQIELHISKFRKWNRFSKKTVLFLLFIGLLMYLLNLVSLPRLQIIPELQFPAEVLFSVYNASLSIFYISGITLLLRNPYFYKLLTPLGAMGKMALTNYLLQTVAGLLIFYEFGLGLFDKSSPFVNVLLGLIVFYIQLKFSSYWLRNYKQGPVEWLWRGLTYFKFQPNKKRVKKPGVPWRPD